jgi:hypothetical protein
VQRLCYLSPNMKKKMREENYTSITTDFVSKYIIRLIRLRELRKLIILINLLILIVIVLILQVDFFKREIIYGRVE